MPEARRVIHRWRWRPARPVLLWLSQHGVLALGADGPGPAVHADFASWCAAHPGLSCRVLLSAECLALITTDPELGLRHRHALLEHARTQFEQYRGGEPGQTNAGPWAVLPWRSRAGSGATALRSPTLASLRAAARQHGVKLLSVQPAWAALLPRLVEARAPQGDSAPTLWLLEEERMLTALLCTGDQPIRLALRRKPADPGRHTAWQAELCAELCAEWQPQPDAAHGLAKTVQVRQLPAALQELPGRAAPRPDAAGDFLDIDRPRRLPQLAAWAAALVAATAGIDTHQAWQQALTAREALQAAGQPTAVQPDRPDTAVQGAARQLQSELRRPWHAVFAATEACAQAGVQWLLMDFRAGGAGAAIDSAGGGRGVAESGPDAAAASASRGELRLEGLAPDLATAGRAAAVLQAQAGIRLAVLTHVRNEADGVRFELRAEWSAPEAPTRIAAAADAVHADPRPRP